MNRAASSTASSSFAPGPLALAGLIVLAALTRLLPHPPNFSPVEAIALFGGAYFASRAWAVLVPLAGMLVSDIVLGVVNGGTYFEYFRTPSFWIVYACILLTLPRRPKPISTVSRMQAYTTQKLGVRKYSK